MIILTITITEQSGGVEMLPQVVDLTTATQREIKVVNRISDLITADVTLAGGTTTYPTEHEEKLARQGNG